MNPLSEATAIRQAVIHKLASSNHTAKELDDLLKRLPSAVRRMGLVRCLEWLEVGKKRPIGAILHKQLARPLRLDRRNVAASVAVLETCPRRELLQTHRRAVRLFDALAIIARIERQA